MLRNNLPRIVFAAGILCLIAAPVAWSQNSNIDVDPLSLGSTQQADQQVVLPLDVSNTGDVDLTWSILEDADGLLRAPSWSDNFDSYATGSQLHGQGGWKGWDNDPTWGALTSATQARSTPNSADIVGNGDLVHEYSGSTSGQWVYTAWQFIPSDFVGLSFFILLNQYADAGPYNWSTQVSFDSSLGEVVSTGADPGTLPLILDAWVEVRVEIDLDLDTQAFYYGNQLLYQGSWSNGVTGGGSLNIGAVNLFANSATTIYYDDMSLASVVCSAPTDIPWLSVSPNAGVTAPAGMTQVDVTFDSTGMAVGAYTANLCIASDDPDPGPGNGTDLVIVPVSMDLEIPVELMSFSVE